MRKSHCAEPHRRDHRDEVLGRPKVALMRVQSQQIRAHKLTETSNLANRLARRRAKGPQITIGDFRLMFPADHAACRVVRTKKSGCAFERMLYAYYGAIMNIDKSDIL